MSEIKYIEPQQESQLYNDVCQIIDGARSRIATYVNTEACLTNWYVGKRIKEDVLYNKRAEYGKQVVRNLRGGAMRSLNIVYAVRTFFRKKKFGTQRVPN